MFIRSEAQSPGRSGGGRNPPHTHEEGRETSCHGVPSAGLSPTKRGAISPLAPMPGTQDKAPWRPRHTLTVLGAKNDSVGTDWQSREGEKGSARGQETASPRGRLGPTESQRVQWVGWEQTDGGTEKCTLGENTQNLRHQTDEEVAIWGQRSTEEAPREASRDTSQSSSTCLAHSSHLANTFCPEKRDDNVSTHARACTHTQQPEAHGLGRQRQDRQTLLHKGQSDPGDRGVTWCCPTMAAVARTRWKQSTFGGQVCTHHPLIL